MNKAVTVLGWLMAGFLFFSLFASSEDVPQNNLLETVTPKPMGIVTNQPEPSIFPTPRATIASPTPQEQSCHSSYSGACLKPYASDYDCAGGSGNGPYYTGTVRVVGPDVFDLDRDQDGWGCE